MACVYCISHGWTPRPANGTRVEACEYCPGWSSAGSAHVPESRCGAQFKTTCTKRWFEDATRSSTSNRPSFATSNLSADLGQRRPTRSRSPSSTTSTPRHDRSWANRKGRRDKSRSCPRISAEPTSRPRTFSGSVASLRRGVTAMVQGGQFGEEAVKRAVARRAVKKRAVKRAGRGAP